MHWRRKWRPTPVFLPGEPQDGRAWWAAVYGVAQNRTRLKRRSSSSSSSSSSLRHRGLGIRRARWTGVLPSKPAQLTDEEICTHVLVPDTYTCTHLYMLLYVAIHIQIKLNMSSHHFQLESTSPWMILLLICKCPSNSENPVSPSHPLIHVLNCSFPVSEY